MSDLLRQVRQAQVRAGEDAVIDNLRKQGLLPATPSPDPQPVPHAQVASEARAEFEACYARLVDAEHFGQYQDPDDPTSWIYLERAVNEAWFWWRAARAALAAQASGPDQAGG